MSRNLLFGEREFSLSVESRADPSTVREFLAAPARWILLHPLVTRIDPDPRAPCTYVVRERLDFGLPFENVYRARISPSPDGIDSEAWAALGTHLRTTFRCVASAGGAGSRIDETCRVRALWPLLGYTTRTAKGAHLAMLRRLSEAASRAS